MIDVDESFEDYFFDEDITNGGTESGRIVRI